MLFFFRILIVVIIFPFHLFAQDNYPAPCPEIDNKKAIKLFQKAQDYYKSTSDNKGTRELLAKVFEEEPNFAEAHLLMAVLARRKEEMQLMQTSYLKAIEICPNYDPDAYYYVGINMYRDAGYDYKKYEEALTYLKTYLKFEKTPDKKHNEIEQYIVRTKFYANLLKNPVPFNLVPLENISTELDEYLPCISADKEVIYFTRKGIYKIPKVGIAGSDKEIFLERFSYSEMQPDGKFASGKPLSAPFNETDNQGGASLSIDNKTMYFTICGSNKKGNLNCDIFSCEYVNGDWDDIKNLGPKVNGEDTWESQPSISADGVTLYFSSIRPTNIGFNAKDNPTCDIYKTIKGADGTWGEPINLGPTINTRGDEKSPYMHSDSKTLYFASNGHLGVGGYDIFFTKQKSDTTWETPKNIGYPINSSDDDLSFIVSTDGKTAYFASDKYKGKGKGGYDIYSFELYREARPEKVLFLKGNVKNDNGEPANANIEIKSMKTNKITQVKVDSVTGKYASIVRYDSDLIVSIKKKGVAFVSQYISEKDTASPSVIKKFDVDLKTVAVGSAYTINNINYGINSADLLPESKFVLNEFIQYLKENPSLKIEINGHTDNVGNDKDNLSLSHDRAFTVFDYLQTNGIDKSRLGFHGYGETKPLASNDTEEGRAKNRRTEFLILAK